MDATPNPMIRDPPNSDGANAKGSRSAKSIGKMCTRMALLARDVQEEPIVVDGLIRWSHDVTDVFLNDQLILLRIRSTRE